MSRRPTTRLRVTSLEDRLTPAGGLDPSFGTGGIVQTPAAWGGARADVAFQPDGRLVVLSRIAASPNETATQSPVKSEEVVRYLPDGTPDRSFGVNGRVTPLAGEFFANVSMAVGPDGKIVLFGGATPPGSWGEVVRPTVVRLNADGSLDLTFGTGGVVRSEKLPSLNSFLPTETAVAVRPDGSVVVAGTELGRLVVARLDPTGAIDTAFGAGGRYAEPPAAKGDWSSISSFRIALTPGGGVAFTSATSDLTDPLVPRDVQVVTQLTPAGALDTSFSGDGVWSSAVEGAGGVKGAWSALAVQPDGKLVLTGVGPADALVAFRLNADGSADTGFGAGGQTVVDAEGVRDGNVSLDLLSDGRVVVAASRKSQSGGTVSVLHPDGRPDDFFADGTGLGHITYRAGGPIGYTSVGDIAVFGDRIAVASSVFDNVATGAASGWASTLGLAVLTERADALPLGTTPVPPPVVAPPAPPAVTPPRNPMTTTPIGGGLSGSAAADPTPPADVVVVPTIPGPAPTLVPLPGPVGAFRVIRVPGDLNGDGVADKAVTDGAKVSVVSGKDGGVLVKAFAPFEASYTGTLNAVFVDIDNDNTWELVVSPGQGGGPVVAVYNADGRERGRFWGIEDANFRGGVNLAAGDLNGDGRFDLVVTAGAGGGPRVAVFDAKTLGANAKRLVADFFAFEATQTGGATAGVATPAGAASSVLIFGAGAGGGPRVRGIDASSLFVGAGVKSLDDLPASARLSDRFVGDPSSRQGVTLDFTGVDLGDWALAGKVTAHAGDGQPVTVYQYPGLTQPDGAA